METPDSPSARRKELQGENSQHEKEKAEGASLGWHVCNKCPQTSRDMRGGSYTQPQVRCTPLALAGGF